MGSRSQQPSVYDAWHFQTSQELVFCAIFQRSKAKKMRILHLKIFKSNLPQNRRWQVFLCQPRIVEFMIRQQNTLCCFSLCHLTNLMSLVGAHKICLERLMSHRWQLYNVPKNESHSLVTPTQGQLQKYFKLPLRQLQISVKLSK